MRRPGYFDHRASLLSMETDPRRWIHALRISHDALLGQVLSLTPTQLEEGSYCRDWDVAQVLSHLGSGAEIGLLGLERTLVNGTLLDREDFAVIWDRWDNLGPSTRRARWWPGTGATFRCCKLLTTRPSNPCG